MVLLVDSQGSYGKFVGLSFSGTFMELTSKHQRSVVIQIKKDIQTEYFV